MTAIQGPSRTAAKAQSRSSSAADWTPTSWRGRPAQQMPVYADAAALAGAETRLRRYPPLVFAGEARKLKAALAKVAAGDAFLLQGGDCAESFAGFLRQQHPRHVPRAAADGGRADLRRRRAGGEGRPHGRPVRQAALVQRREDRRASSCRPTAATTSTASSSPPRRACPIPSAWCRPITSRPRRLNLLRAFAQGGYADLHEVNRWNLDFVQQLAGVGALPRPCRAPRRDAELHGRLRAHLGDHAADRRDRLLHQPRGAAAAVRGGADPRRIRPRATGTTARPTCCGSATARASPTAPMSSSCAACAIRWASRRARRSRSTTSCA